MLCKWSSFSRVWFSEYLLNLPGLGTELLTCYIGILLRDMVRKSDENAWVQQQDLRKTTTMFPKGQADIIAFEDAGFFKGFKKGDEHIIGTVSMLYLMAYHLGKFLIAPQTGNLNGTCFSLGFGNQHPQNRPTSESLRLKESSQIAPCIINGGLRNKLRWATWDPGTWHSWTPKKVVTRPHPQNIPKQSSVRETPRLF